MPSGYEKSPDYGGPEPDFHQEKLLVIIGVLLIIVFMAWSYY